MPPDTKQALVMVDAFGSVGVRQFQITMLDIDEVKTGYQVRSLDDLKRHMSGRLEAAARSQVNIIVRPSPDVFFVQLDDLNASQAARAGKHGFMTLETSPGNYQVWLAVSKGPQENTEAAKELRRRAKKGSGSDKSASQATRLAGSLNIKHKYAPDFPVVTVHQAQPGKTVTVAELDAAGLLAASEVAPPAVPAAVFPKKASEQPSRPNAPRKWPDYGRALAGAPLNNEGTGPDRSLADFMFCKWAAERGWLADEIAVKLPEVSDKAKERDTQGDKGYATVTARNAVLAVEKDRGRRQALKQTSRYQL